MTIPNTLGWDSTKWLSDSNATPITLFRYTSTTSEPSMADISLHESSSSSLTGTDYKVPTSRVFDLMYLQFTTSSTTDLGLGIQANTSADTRTSGTLKWSQFLEGSSNLHNLVEWYFGGGLHFVADDYILPYDMQDVDRLRWACWGWGVESDA